MKKVFFGGISQESNTFSPIPTRYEDFDILRGGMLLDAFEGIKTLKNNGYEIVPSIFAGAMSGGMATLQAYRSIIEELLSYLPLDGSIDGVCLVLHGALEVEFIGSAEAFLVSAIRERVG